MKELIIFKVDKPQDETQEAALAAYIDYIKSLYTDTNQIPLIVTKDVDIYDTVVGETEQQAYTRLILGNLDDYRGYIWESFINTINTYELESIIDYNEKSSITIKFNFELSIDPINVYDYGLKK